jgi:hypothetical protein
MKNVEALKLFQKKLTANKRLRAEFIRDPSNTLRQQGIILPAEVEMQLADSVRRQANGKSDHQVLLSLAVKF